MILVGVILLLLEVLVLPSGIAGVVGLAMIGVAIWQSFVLSTTTGIVVSVVTLVVSILSVVITMKSKTWNRAALHNEIDGKANDVNISKLSIGEKGKAVSRLAPMGKAMLGDEYYEVATLGEFVDHNSDIEIIKIDGNKIIVKQINE